MSKASSPGLGSAYSLQSPEDSIRLYADWASTYDADFADSNGYILPAQVARMFVRLGGEGPVLDIGAGTGLLAEALKPSDIGPVDATDISQEMLDVAETKCLYRQLFTGDVTQTMPVDDGAYNGIVSSGTFTHGHVGPEALDEVLRMVKTGGLVTLSINAEHYAALGFAAKLDALRDKITDLALPQLPIYASDSQSAHKEDLAVIASFRKA
jgi:predicted TPR repeat methyltransferase